LIVGGLFEFLENFVGEFEGDNGKICIVKIKIEKVEDIQVCVEREGDHDYISGDLQVRVSIIAIDTIM
jgi:hypothetical protein